MLRTPIRFDPERPNLERNTGGGCFFLAVTHDSFQGAEPSAPKTYWCPQPTPLPLDLEIPNSARKICGEERVSTCSGVPPPQIFLTYVQYGILEFNVPLDTV